MLGGASQAPRRWPRQTQPRRAPRDTHGCTIGHYSWQTLAARHRALAVRVCLDHVGINGEAFAAYQSFAHAPRHSSLEQLAQQIAVAEPPVPVFGKCRVIGNATIQSKSAEPPIGKVQVHFLAEPAFRADAHAITDDQHPNHQLRIDRWPTCLTVVGPQMVADGTKIDKTVDGAEQVILGHMTFEAEAVKQRLLQDRPLTHHGLTPRLLTYH